MQVFGIVSFIQINLVNLRQIQNLNKNHYAIHFDPNDDETALGNNRQSIQDCNFLIYQCAIGSDLEIRDMLKWNHPWIITVRDYAKKHGNDIFK